MFFFKQKTVYEVRISDWSSDVCSSDLFEIGRALHPYAGPAQAAIFPRQPGIAGSVIEARVRNQLKGQGIYKIHFAALFRSADLQDGRYCLREIGRASCRERVCQYV